MCVSVVISVCKRLKEQVMVLERPIQGIAPLRLAILKLQPSTEHLTALHPEYLLLCLLSKCYKAGLKILEDEIYEVDQPKDFFLYCYYGWVICFTASYLKVIWQLKMDHLSQWIMLWSFMQVALHIHIESMKIWLPDLFLLTISGYIMYDLMFLGRIYGYKLNL